MVQMVFAHGVNTRKVPNNTSYEDALAALTRRFTEVAFKGAGLIVHAPYWGEFGAPALYSCIPRVGGAYGALSLGDAADPTALLDAARTDLVAVVSALSAAALEEARAKGDEDALRDAERLWLGAALYAEQKQDNPPAWLGTVPSDTEFLEKLMAEARLQQPGRAQDLGLADEVKAIAARVKGGLSNLVNAPIAKIARDKLSPHVAVFIGDVFRYLKDGEGRKKIRGVVTDHIVTAANAAGPNDKLVLAGHSMGGVILYDILSDASAVSAIETRLGNTLKVDLLLTIGSQVALFEELKVYAASGPVAPAPAGKIARPAPVALWWNVFDKMDVLSFLCAPVFANVEDFEMDTIAGVLDAHGAYFESMPFYVRLGSRLKTAKLVP